MATLETKSPVAIAIEDYYYKHQEIRDWTGIRCGQIGDDCARSIWYSLRWASSLKPFEGRMKRLLETGHREEARMINDLRNIGCDVLDRDPDTEQQWAVTFLDGHVRGAVDGIVWRIPKTDTAIGLVLECKTMNKKSFDEWRKHGVQFTKPLHYSQMQMYMKFYGMDRALYMVHCKDDDRVETETVLYDPDHADALLNKAALILNADEPPERNESFSCRWCNHKKVCLEGAWPRVNCRTCIDFRFTKNGGWFCDLHQCELSLDAQKVPCDKHISLPGLIPNAQIVTADEDERTVTYQFADGTTFVDGRDLKPAAPESE